MSTLRFTHVDPFEDTERRSLRRACASRDPVSPTSIRSRILKAQGFFMLICTSRSFTHVDPFEDTERSDSSSAARHNP